MKRENLIAYAVRFISFLLDESIAKDIDKIILFGSVARGDFDEESDIDIFIDTTKNIEKEVHKVLTLFEDTEIEKKWRLKGLKNELSIKVGELNKWKLKRGLLTDGIILYGKFKELPENLEYYILLTPSFNNLEKSQKIRLWRLLYGYKQKVGKKVYITKGLVEKSGGGRIAGGIIIPAKNKKMILEFLNKEKLNYKIREMWSDSL